jgi:CubicO group peptidase (beta-lactamase class C family)
MTKIAHSIAGDLSPAIDAVIVGRGLAVPDRPGAMVAVLLGGEPLHVAGYGCAVPEFGVGWGPEMRYSVASWSKTFTAQAVLRLVAEGALTLDADVRDIVPTMGGFPVSVRVEHLLTMSSGIRVDEDMLRIVGVRGRVDDAFLASIVARQRELNFTPGSQQLYSCSNYRILARAIEAVTGATFEDAMRTLVFEPLGMHDSLFARYPSEVELREARLYGYGDRTWELGEWDVSSTGDGGAKITMADAITWLTATRLKTTAGVPSLATLARIERLESGLHCIYRYGLEHRRQFGLERWSHSGSTGTIWLHLPEPDLSVMMFQNDGRSPDAAPTDIARVVLAAMDAGDLDDDLVRADATDSSFDAVLGTWVEPSTALPVEIESFEGLRAVSIGDVGSFLLARGEGRYELADSSAIGAVVVESGRPPLLEGAAFEQPVHLAPVTTAPPLDGLEGRYRSPELAAELVVARRGGSLELVRGLGEHPQQRTPLEVTGLDRARAGGLGVLVERAADGGVVAIIVSHMKARRIRFERISP